MQTVDFRHFPLKDSDRVLDLGCGEGRHLIGALLTADVQAVGVDLSHEDLVTGRTKTHDWADSIGESRRPVLTQASGYALPFADNTFDAVICSEVLEHVPVVAKVLQEIDRVLRPGGRLVISVPRRWPERICWWLSSDYHLQLGGHLRIFRIEELKYQIQKLPVTFYHQHGAHALHVPYWWLRCVFWSKPDALLVRWYHKVLVWDLMKRPWLTQCIEALTNGWMGKSVVLYYRKQDVTS
jgi:SAM-dependent methyltransferase